jgi:hypothetical protein
LEEKVGSEEMGGTGGNELEEEPLMITGDPITTGPEEENELLLLEENTEGVGVATPISSKGQGPVDVWLQWILEIYLPKTREKSEKN